MSKNLVITDLDATLSSINPGLRETDWAKFLGAFKHKLQSLADQHTDVMESLSPMVKKRVEALRVIQSQYDEFEAKFSEERATLEAKYQKLYEPLYTKRYDIVNGLVEVEDSENENGEGTPPKDTVTEEKGIPDFWLIAMRTNVVLAKEIQERDKEALKFLKDIKWCKIDNRKGFKLEFFFNANPFFKNSVLTKIYHMIDEEETTIEKAIGTEIEWLPEKCFTQKLMEKMPRKGSNTKPITKTENRVSFFNFFNPPQVPGEDIDIDEETAEALQNEMEQHYDIGSTIRDKIIPHAVSWFTGELVHYDDFGMSENDEDVEEEESKIKMKKSGLAGAEVDHLPECKQQ